MARTLRYYEAHAADFIERTAGVSMEHMYRPFLALIPLTGHILDAGCGSGRDAAEFARRGYEVTAFDGSAEMAKLAFERTGLPVFHLTFDQMAWNSEFDGIWACASLLHVPSEHLEPTLRRIVDALKPGGVLFVSMKLGDGEGYRADRWFVDMTPDALSNVLTAAGLELFRVWTTSDARPDSAAVWVNGLARRVASGSSMRYRSSHARVDVRHG
jgi:SAM-dependent methyltransferase